LPLDDIVVDTNVWMHAQTPGQKYMGRAIALCQCMRYGRCVLRLDSGFHITESRNRSRIGSEYHDKLRFDRNPGKLSVETIALLFRTRRVKEASIAIDRGPKKILEKLIKKPRDRTFVRVTRNTLERTFVTHDWEDFTKAKRTKLGQALDITCIDAGEARKKV
jgi:hypothetical protein